MLEFLEISVQGVLVAAGVILTLTLTYLFFIVPLSALWFLTGEIKEAIDAILNIMVKNWQDRVTHWQRQRFRREMNHITRHQNYLDAITIVNAFRLLECEEVDAHVDYEYNGQQHTASLNSPEDAARLLHALVDQATANARKP